MSGAPVYLDVISLIRNKPFRVLNVPISYSTTFSEAVKDVNGQIISPIYDPDPTETTSWRISITTMVDMFFNDVPFRFSSIEDLEEIFGHLSLYVDWIKGFREVPQDHMLFVSRVMPFLRFITDRCNRVRFGKQQKGLIAPSFGDNIFSNVIQR